MSDWTAGYVADIGYTYGYYGELNPLRTQLAFLTAGIVPPQVTNACELGFGQGLSVAMHATASPVQWWGTDFNPSQAAFARELVAASGTTARLYDDAFAEFAQRTDLPEFDYIGLHGIWSWINDENRHVIVDFLRRKLKVGGAVYISYNTFPGWSQLAPVRHLMAAHADTISASGQGTLQRVNGALEFAQRLLETQPQYARNFPQIPARIEQMKAQNRQYLAHEFFNRDWHPMHFGTMAQWLEPAKLGYACSAHHTELIESINLSQPQSAFLREFQDPVFREEVRDFMVNQQFRRDYWVRGARRLSPLERTEALRNLRLMLVTPRKDVPTKVTCALGEATLDQSVYGPVLDYLADHKPRTLGQMEQALAPSGIKLSALIELTVILSGAGQVAAVQEDAVVQKARKQTDKLNAHILSKARGGEDIKYLASPMTGGAVSVGRGDQLMLLALNSGRKQPAEWVALAWQILASQGHRLVKDGKVLETEEENVEELKQIAVAFVEKRLPVLKALQIA